MSEQTVDLNVRRTITVNATPERAFEVFTTGLETWWPLDSHHIGEQDAVAAGFEPYAGGRLFERAADGSECIWGFVTAWEPPTRLVYAWHLNADWNYDPDPASASEVEVSFVADGDATRVELVHRNLEVYGDRAGEVHEAIGGEGGWTSLLVSYGATF